MTRDQYRRTPLDALDRIPADMPLRAASEVALALGGFVLPVQRDQGLAAVRAIDLRSAAQLTGDATIGEHVDPAIVHESVAAAHHWLDAHLHEGAALVTGGEPALVERDVPRITTAIVMAGGKGTRLQPLTDDTPKPLLEVGGRVLLFRILDRLKRHGVTRVFVSIHHLGQKVRAALGDGSAWNMEIAYLEEDTPLDTGAGLALMRDTDAPFFVVNGDILTTLDFTLLGRWHQLEDALATIATYRYPAPLPYGVVHHDERRVLSIEEKPVHRYDINAGIYAFSPRALQLVERGRPLAMVDFLNDRTRAGDRVCSFPIVEYWNDVGTHDDFARAQTEVHSL